MLLFRSLVIPNLFKPVIYFRMLIMGVNTHVLTDNCSIPDPYYPLPPNQQMSPLAPKAGTRCSASAKGYISHKAAD